MDNTEIYLLYKDLLEFRMRTYDWNRSKQTKEIQDFVDILRTCEPQEIFNICTQTFYNPKFEWIEPQNTKLLLEYLSSIEIPEEHKIKYKLYMQTIDEISKEKSYRKQSCRKV